MANEEEAETERIGYRSPPRSTRFAKGQSGNPKGRPRGRKSGIPYDAVLGQQVMVREEGVDRRVSAAEAFLLHLMKKGLEGDGAAARAAMAAIEEARAGRGANFGKRMIIIWQCVAPGSVNPAMRPLNMARKLDPYRDTARMTLEPWLVQAALARLGDSKLTKDDQVAVLKATRTPKKVRWPDWWAVLP